jgi:hypothetical protein
MVNGPDDVYVEREGPVERVGRHDSAHERHKVRR